MRVLLTSQPGFGHFHPMVPLAQALEAAGHRVAFACVPTFCPTIEANGFRCFPVGAMETDEELRQMRKEQAGMPMEERAGYMWVRSFAGFRAERSLPDLLALAKAWKPDIIVRDVTEFSGYIVAECLGLPHTTMQLAAYRPDLQRMVAGQLNQLRESIDLAGEPELSRLHHYLMLSPRPGSFQDPAAPLPPTAHAIRHGGFNASASEQLPEWVGELGRRPTVYATLGTIFNELTDIFAAILEGLRGEQVNLVITVGRNVDPAVFGPQPPNVHIEHYIPQSLLLPYCDLVITHGGSGTVMDALSHGIPMVIIPIAADQPPNARSSARLGTARVIAPDRRTPDAIREAALDVLNNSMYRQNAERIRDEMGALPGWDYAVGLLERLAVEKSPILSA